MDPNFFKYKKLWANYVMWNLDSGEIKKLLLIEIMCDKNTVNVLFKFLCLRELYQDICQLMTQHLIIASNKFSFEGNREMDKAELAIS